MPSLEARTESQRLVYEALRLMLEDGELSDVENCLVKAIEFWGDNLEALEEAAHFFDAVMSNPIQAVRYAELCRDRAATLATAMDEIIQSNKNPQERSTHI